MTKKECEAKLLEASMAIRGVMCDPVFEVKGYSEADVIFCELQIALDVLYGTLNTDWWEDEE